MELRRVFCIFFIIIITLLSTKAHACFMKDDMRESTSSYTIDKGVVIDIECRWNEKHTAIETQVSVKIDSAIEDSEEDILHIVVPGGFLPEEGIALIVSGQDQFRPGDRVIIFSGNNSSYFVKKNSLTYQSEETGTDIPKGFTYYCYNDDTLELSCSADMCELGISWPRESIPVTYYIHSSFSPYQIEAIESAMETWNSVNTLFRGIYGGITELNEASPDGINVIRFAEEGEIPHYQLARCYIWTDLEGKIFDADISLNPHYVWGTTGNLNECDIQNILTHEIGHFIGLGDIYEPGEKLFIPCMGGGHRENTMYGFSGKGETKKRTLALGEIIGIQSLYGCAVTVALEGDEEALNTIRNFVDSMLIKTAWGKNFTNFYYEISPQLSSYFLTHPKMKLRAERTMRSIIPLIEMLSSSKNP